MNCVVVVVVVVVVNNGPSHFELELQCAGSLTVMLKFDGKLHTIIAHFIPLYSP